MCFQNCLFGSLFPWLSHMMPPILPMLSSSHTPPLGSIQPTMSSHSPPLAPPFDLSVCMAEPSFLSLSPGRHLARQGRSIPGTAPQENPVSCHPLIHAAPASATPSVKLMYKHKMDTDRYSKKETKQEQSQFKTNSAFIVAMMLIKYSSKICQNKSCI